MCFSFNLICMCTRREQNRVSYPLEQESWVVVRLQVGAGNQASVVSVLNLSIFAAPEHMLLITNLIIPKKGCMCSNNPLSNKSDYNDPLRCINNLEYRLSNNLVLDILYYQVQIVSAFVCFEHLWLNESNTCRDSIFPYPRELKAKMPFP